MPPDGYPGCRSGLSRRRADVDGQRRVLSIRCTGHHAGCVNTAQAAVAGQDTPHPWKTLVLTILVRRTDLLVLVAHSAAIADRFSAAGERDAAATRFETIDHGTANVVAERPSRWAGAGRSGTTRALDDAAAPVIRTPAGVRRKVLARLRRTTLACIRVADIVRVWAALGGANLVWTGTGAIDAGEAGYRADVVTRAAVEIVGLQVDAGASATRFSVGARSATPIRRSD